jgi:NAD(P)H-flavin reductase
MNDVAHIPMMATISAIRPLTGDTALLNLHLDNGLTRELAAFTPGQFIQLSVPAGGEIPISLTDKPGEDGTLELCVRRIGQVTALLHHLRPGDRVGVRGPCGTGFPVTEMVGNHVLLLAGGLGIAPLRSLLFHALREKGSYASVTLMYGAREPSVMLFRDELVALARNSQLKLFLTVDFAAEQPSGDFTCAIGLLPDLLQGISFPTENTYVAVCGPPALYRCLMGELIEAGFAAERILVSLERRMQCGIGRCCHCAVGQFLCCCDGPVFRYSTISHIPGAL